MNMMQEHQKENLRHLYNFIKSTPVNVIESGFDMSGFCGFEIAGDYNGINLQDQVNQMLEQSNVSNPHTCGSSKCLIGWSASVPELFKKIPIDSKGRVNMDWDDMARLLFGAGHSSTGYGEYLFSAEWGDCEETNTVEHALMRIEKVLAAETEDDYEELQEEYQDFLEEMI